MTAAETTNLRLVRAYLEALERGETGSALAAFFTPDARQIELPNRLNPAGGESNLERLLLRAEQGRNLLVSQRYTLRSALARDNNVAVEAEWVATLAVPVGSLPAGGEMRAHFAMFFECMDGRIHRQRNYDCFEPW